MLEQTFNKLNNIIAKLKGDVFTKSEIEQLSIEIRSILLDADLPFDYIKNLIQDMQQRLLNINVKKIDKKAVIGGILQSYIDETFNHLSGKTLTIKKNDITTIGIFGPNGVGKTTVVSKIANFLKTTTRKRIMCVSFDITRFASQEQLKILCEKFDVEYLNIVDKNINDGLVKVNEIIKQKVVDVLIIDFAGISPDNENGKNIWQLVLNNARLDERIVVLDSTFGQNTINLIRGFDKIVNITGFIVSKTDSDQKGGVFFAIASASNKPIYYISTGEKKEDISYFNKRMISDALFSTGGLRNVIASFQESNKEYIKTVISQKQKNDIDYNDLLKQLTQLVSFGKLDKVLSVLPHTKSFFNVKLSTEAYILIKKWISIIMSMTKFERQNVKCLNLDRMNRIAKGAGVDISDIITLQKKIEEINREQVLQS